MKKKGFTLIELLIVVAIIAILAAIAVPNFLEAQTRSKVSRVKADMRTLATGLEAYFVDNQIYPRDHDNYDPPFDRWSGRDQVGWFYITTPIAYISSLPFDPFMPHPDTGSRYLSDKYILSSGGDNTGVESDGTPHKASAYFMNSIGPNVRDDTGSQDPFPWGGASVTSIWYDPTNGTLSRGDIYRYGGNYRMGKWIANQRPWWEWGNFGPSQP